MPLTSKGEEIKKALQEEYGEKKGEQVLYAGKNKGTFTGIDEMMMPTEAGTLSPTGPGMMESMEDKLPTFDMFIKRFTDAVKAGDSLENCLNLGVTWGTAGPSKEGNTKKYQPFQGKDAFRKAMKDSIAKGLSFDKAIEDSLAEIGGEIDMLGYVISGTEGHSAHESVAGGTAPTGKWPKAPDPPIVGMHDIGIINTEEWPEAGPGAGQEPSYRVVLDRKRTFKDSMKKLLKLGFSDKDALDMLTGVQGEV